MKVAFLFGSLNRGGTETLMLDVCQSLQNTDFEAVGVYRKSGVLEEAFHLSKIPFTKISVGKNPVQYLLRLRKIIKQNDIDILHAQQPIDAFLGKLAGIGLKKKHVLSFHGFDFEQKNSLIRYIIKRTDANIYVSSYQKRYYQKKYKLKYKNQVVVYNGVNFDKFSTVNQEQSFRKELELDSNITLIGMVGNFVKGRDHATVCRFIKELNKKHDNYHFIFVGKKIDTYADKYDECVSFCKKNKLKDKVSFLGMRSDVPEILPQLDAFIYSTDHDTFGIAVIEAIAAEIPVFVNDWGVMREITKEGKLAILYKTKDEFDLLEKFSIFLQNKELYKTKAQEAMQIVREKYSIQNHIQNLKTLYENLLNKNLKNYLPLSFIIVPFLTNFLSF